MDTDSENTEPLGLPTIHDPDGHWNPVMSAANDLDMVACMHVGSSSTLPQNGSGDPARRLVAGLLSVVNRIFLSRKTPTVNDLHQF